MLNISPGKLLEQVGVKKLKKGLDEKEIERRILILKKEEESKGNDKKKHNGTTST